MFGLINSESIQFAFLKFYGVILINKIKLCCLCKNYGNDGNSFGILQVLEIWIGWLWEYIPVLVITLGVNLYI